MQILIIVLLVLNIVGVLFWVIHSFNQPIYDSRQNLSQKILENQNQLFRELMEVKAKANHYYQLIQQESERFGAEGKAFESEAQVQAEPKKVQNLFLNDRYQEIFDLQKQGLTVEEIAKKLEKGCGEVSLILELASQEQA